MSAMLSVRVPHSRKPVPHRWALHEYRALDRTHLFHTVKTMLLHGELYVLPFPRPPHDVALTATDEFLRSVCPPGHYVRNQQSLDIGTDSGPDLAVVPGDINDYSAAEPTSAVFVVEVADESLALDMTTKADLYATAGVPEYWVVDVEHRQLVIFRDPHPLPAGLWPGCEAERFGPPSPPHGRRSRTAPTRPSRPPMPRRPCAPRARPCSWATSCRASDVAKIPSCRSSNTR